MKKIKLKESDIEKLVEKIMIEESFHSPDGTPIPVDNNHNPITEDLPERELHRKKTQYRKSEFDPYRREGQIQDIFGPYAQDVPPNVIQYMRKNPKLIISRLVDVYGRETVFRHLGII